MDILREFFQNYYLWRDPVFVGAVAGFICGLLGVFVVLKRIVFLSAAFTQVSSFGVVLAFYLQTITLSAIFDPYIVSIVVTSLFAVFFSLKKDFFPITLEGIIGFSFLISASLIFILSDRIVHGLHDINNILFGSAVVVDSKDIIIIPLISLLTAAIYYLLYKDLIFVSFDDETARLYNYPVKYLNGFIYVSIGIVVCFTSRALGALPVFALLALPALTALYTTDNLRNVFIVSCALGILSSVLGYLFSYVFSFPTGATIAFCASVFFVLGLIKREVNIF